MLIPYGQKISVDPGKDSTLCAIELSPDGKLYAIATANSIQLWSAGPSLFLLAERAVQRSSNATAQQLRQILLVWREDCSSLAVVCGEGIVEIFAVEYEESLFELDSSTESTAYFPTCSIHVTCLKIIDEFGCPLCVDSLQSSILLGTDQGILVEMEWDGTSRGYPITAPIMIYLPEVGRDLPSSLQITSINYSSSLRIIVLVLSNGMCILFHILYTNRIHFNNGFVLQPRDCIRSVLGRYNHLLATVQKDGSILVYRLQWVNDSLLPKEELTFNIAVYDHLYPPSTDTPSTAITALTWNWENDHLAVIYEDRGLVVWNAQESPIYWYAYTEPLYCCCFSAIGDALLFPGRDHELLCQSFLLTNNAVVCKSIITPPLTRSSHGSFAAYNTNTLFIASSPQDRSVLPTVYSIPQSFTHNCNWPLLGMCANDSGSRVLLYTCSDVCVYLEDLDLWKVATGLTEVRLRGHAHS